MSRLIHGQVRITVIERTLDELSFLTHMPGKNCEGGIGNIIKGPYDDPSGDDPCYTVRFTVGSTEKNVEAEYISPYSFGNVTRRKREKEI